jgi:eukaryotic-like serine/threonine-protein kinase
MTDLRSRLQDSMGTAYTLGRELGGGGMSRVFVAEEMRLGRQVVVKVLSPELAAGVSAERFEREIKLAAALQQANIVPVLSTGEMDGLPYYTMPFVEGLSLRARMARGGEMSVVEVVSILRDVARALAYAHEHGVVHRDIKPENVLLSGDAAVVTDFGIAKALSAARTQTPGGTLTQVGTSLGTPAYMAPEQAAGDPATDHRADLYALGCVAYEMLTGAPPFAGRPVHQLFAAHMNEVPKPLAAQRADVQRPLAELVMRCLEKDPARRPQSAREVLQSLDGVTSGAHATDSATKGRWWLGAAALTVSLAVGGWLLLRGTSSDANTGGSGSRSVAVLPFANASRDTASNYFADGMSDEVAGVLAKLPDMRVASRRSVDVVREKQMSPQEIGKALGVGLLLEGTVRRVGDRVRVSAQLTNAADGTVRWSQSYDRAAGDAFQLQDDISSAIARELQVALSGTALAVSRAGRTDNAEAYDLYLRGRYAAATVTEAGMRQALVLYARALALDPKFAKAQAEIGIVWIFLADDFEPSAEAYPRVLEAARRALAMDSLVAEAHAAYGYATTALTLDTAGLGAMRRATELDPNSAQLHLLYGQAVCWLAGDNCAEGVRQMEKAVALDPLSALPRWGLASTLYSAKRYDEAIAAQQRLRELDPRFFAFDDWAAASWREKGDYARALQAYQAAQPLSSRPLYGLAVTYARVGRTEDARRIARELERLRGQRHIFPDGIAMIYASLRDGDRTFEWLERSRRERSAWLMGVTVLPEYAPIRGDPRWAAFVRSLRSR